MVAPSAVAEDPVSVVEVVAAAAAAARAMVLALVDVVVVDRARVVAVRREFVGLSPNPGRGDRHGGGTTTKP